jgi:predicted RecA/RadA family phage recombinase
VRNFVQPGETLEVTAPTGGVSSGDVVVIGALVGVAAADAAEGAPVNVQTCGVFDVPKTSAQAWAVGDRIYWNASTSKAENLPAAGLFMGLAVAAAANPSATGRVSLGCGPELAEGAQAAIADLTMGTNITAATANGSLEDSAATNPSDTNFNNNMKELGAKVNAILAALRTAGIVASS